MRLAPRLAAALAVATLLTAGCASQRVALLSNEDGKGAGAVAVLDPQTGAERGEIAMADTEASLAGKGALKTKAVDARKPWFGDLAARMPYPPQTYVLYFYEGTSDITTESAPILEALKKAVNANSDVQITGHTDTVGSSDANDRLSLKRAEDIRALLVKEGLPVENSKVAGRGEREPLVKTPDNTAEPANRRVEVVLRY
ncbi:OmpA family protein [Phenylobacterium sp.]|uniref:OmpA family protein n=1 Tax=Phenylobacterium sp. TaxID=1871053 RepID=UPI0025EFA3DB|nr:OmpA family protein [Phenylobacterium sp.]MBX3485590.1 OmpA family protein [Phenylobacterium sp.]MCW5758175.1 OmpA family protein [Phenylobacterium sp.]